MSKPKHFRLFLVISFCSLGFSAHSQQCNYEEIYSQFYAMKNLCEGSVPEQCAAEFKRLESTTQCKREWQDMRNEALSSLRGILMRSSDSSACQRSIQFTQKFHQICDGEGFGKNFDYCMHDFHTETGPTYDACSEQIKPELDRLLASTPIYSDQSSSRSDELNKRPVATRKAGEKHFPSCMSGPKLVYTDMSGNCLDFASLREGQQFQYKGATVTYDSQHSGTFAEMAEEQYQLKSGSGGATAFHRPVVKPKNYSSQDKSQSGGSECAPMDDAGTLCAVSCTSEFAGAYYQTSKPVLENRTYKNYSCTSNCQRTFQFQFCYESGYCESRTITPERPATAQLDSFTVSERGDVVSTPISCN